MKHLYMSKEEVTVRLAENVESTGRAMWRKIFRTVSKEILVQDICLPVHLIQELKKSKLKSLAKKYSCIPKEYLAYYPQPPEATSSDKETDWMKEQRSARHQNENCSTFTHLEFQKRRKEVGQEMQLYWTVTNVVL